MKELNPFCHCITGRPRTPRDQGSIERTNRGIKNVLCKMVIDKQTTAKTAKEKAAITWVTELGSTMRAINTLRVKGKDQVEPYEMVFTRKYDEPLFAGLMGNDCRYSHTVDARLKHCGAAFQHKMELLGEVGNADVSEFYHDP